MAMQEVLWLLVFVFMLVFFLLLLWFVGGSWSPPLPLNVCVLYCISRGITGETVGGAECCL